MYLRTITFNLHGKYCYTVGEWVLITGWRFKFPTSNFWQEQGIILWSNILIFCDKIDTYLAVGTFVRLRKLFRTLRRLANIWAKGVTMRSSPWLKQTEKNTVTTGVTETFWIITEISTVETLSTITEKLGLPPHKMWKLRHSEINWSTLLMYLPLRVNEQGN
jgi:hypothetical protein